MKKKYFLAFIAALCIYSCTNEQGDNEISTKITTEKSNISKPYISPKMQEILNILDTCKEAIPIEKLCPFATNSKIMKSSEYSKSIISRAEDPTTVVTGYDVVTALYTKQKTIINSTQSLNFDIPTGTYYVTCHAATKDIYFSTTQNTVFSCYKSGDVMGINPDNLNAIGYNMTAKYTGRYYTLTTYYWEITDDGNPGTSTGGLIYPHIPDELSFRTYPSLIDYLSHTQWRYMSF